MANDDRPPVVALSRHGGEKAAVTALEFVREDRNDLLAIADQTGRLQLVNLTDRNDVRAVNHTSVVYDLTYLPRPTESPGLAATGVGGKTFAYDSSGHPLLRPIEHPEHASGLAVEAFSQADGRTVIAVGGKDETVYLYDGETGDRLNALATQHRGAVHGIKALRLERQLAVAHDGGITLWDLNAGARGAHCLQTIGTGDNRSLAVFYDPQGRLRIATAGRRGVQIWDPSAKLNSPPLSHFAKDLNVTTIIAVTSPDGDPQLAVAHGSGVSLWSTATEQQDGEPLVQHRGHVEHLAKILTGAGTTLLAAGDDRGQVVVWEFAKVRATTRLYGRHDRWVNALVSVGSGGSHRLISASDDRTVKIWSPDPGSVQTRPGHNASIQALTLVPGARELLVTGDEAGVVGLWQLPDAPEPTTVETHKKVRAVAAYCRGDRWYVMAAGGDGTMTVIDPERHEAIDHGFTYPDRGGDVLIRAVAAEHGCGVVAAGDSRGRVTVWDTATGELRWTDTHHHKGQVRTLAWVSTADGPRLASGGGDGLIYLWSPDEDPAAPGRPAWVSPPFEGHSGPVSALAPLSVPTPPDATGDEQVHLFVSGGADGTIRTWNPGHRGTSAVLHSAHPTWVRCLLRFEHGGELYVISGGDDGTVRQWVVEEGALRSTRHEVLLHGFGDRPARHDLLGRSSLRDELVRLLRLAVPAPGEHDDARPATGHDDVVTTGPRVIALQGAWGSGKTSLMRMIFDAFRRDPRSAASLQDLPAPPSGPAAKAPRGPRRFTPWNAYRLASRSSASRRAAARPTERRAPTTIVPVWFNPWAHKSTDEVWAGLTQTIIGAARPLLGRTDAQWHRYWFTRNLDRLDPALIRRSLRQRILRPMLPALVLPIVPILTTVLKDGRITLAGIIACGALLAVLGARALLITFWGHASGYLPADLLEGPVRSRPFAAGAATDALLHDPLYQARAGYLYLVQHDVNEVVRDLADSGGQLVVFVDDLDRCPPATVAEVFEAINIFLGVDFSSARFVIGLDPSVVTRRLGEALRPEESGLWHYPDDPNPSWSFLRKLCQLPITLPEITEAHTARLMRRHTPPIVTPAARAAATPKPAPSLKPAAGPPPKPAVAFTEPAAAASRTAVNGNGQDTLLFEGDPVVRDHLRALIKLRPHQSVRETKRLLTLWGFYVRLLRRLLPEDTTASAHFGRDVLTFAEVLARWPALIPALGPRSSTDSGLRTLIASAASRSDYDVDWQLALRRLGLDGAEYRAATANLRRLLAEHGNDEVAYYGECVL